MTVLNFSSPLFLYLFLSMSSVQAITSDIYVLDTSYSGSTFFDGFDFWTDPDPTHGFVSYQSHAHSLTKSLISTSNNIAHIGVDHNTVLNPDGRDGGRASVRISSKKRFTHGLFLTDVRHMPGSVCGVWPAYWMFGPDWPSSGEIDIIEGVSLQQVNVMTLHSGDTCTVSGANSLGTLQSSDCNQNNGYGCSITSDSPFSYGSSFNNALGGVYATQWTSDYIRIWFFPRPSIPTDILSGEPDPSTWGLPDANFQGNCDVDGFFKDHQIVFDTTFCGDWAGSVWSGDEVCKAKSGTCQEFVASNPEAFADAYWDINYVKVFTLTNAPPPASTKAVSSSKIASVPDPEPTSSKPPSISTSTLASNTQLPTTSKPSFTIEPSSPTTSFPPFPTSPHNTSIHTIPTIPNWTYIGCLSSTVVSIGGFNISLGSENMTIPLCAALCSSSAYLAILDESCYCGSRISDEAALIDSQCSTPCPGSWTQPCGGYGDNETKKKRGYSHLQDHALKTLKPRVAFYFFTVYQNRAVVIDPADPSASQSNMLYSTPDPSEVHFAPSTGEIPTPATSLVPASTLIGVPMGGSADTTSTSIHINIRSVTSSTIVSPKGTLIGIGMGGGLNTSTSASEKGAGSTYTTVITTTYTDICHCAASTLKIYTTTSTLITTHCGCTSPHTHPHHHHETKHSIPMTTLTRICMDCGGNGVVAVTIPFYKSTSTPSLLSPSLPSPSPPYTSSRDNMSEQPEQVTHVKIETAIVLPQPPPIPQPVLRPGNSSNSSKPEAGKGNETLPVTSRAETVVLGLQWRTGLCVLFGLAGLVVWAL